MRSGSQIIDRDPPRIVEDGGGGGGWALLLTANGIIEAQLVSGLLEDAGVIPVVLDGHDPSPGAWMFLSGNVNAPVRVFVPASQLESARLALLESGLGLGAPDAAEPTDVAPRPWLRRGWIFTAALILAAIGSVLLAAACGDTGSC